ncbi:MAG: transketolase [Candidatus Marinimicrobia bacterium]|jgi:transketolase|nr:transketolase [Candidatus Neomarinimicrobiota bacterium]MBT3501339.1 transketolase [Candidatus Neomarinimicrobiota bacterium]MBT3838539.1 transketolase [Candidatus Neomarinimicrobiota bacterium]MBT3999921.1 transketolase [Candidatus Neomarinimicrobiota bacterium]MBT4282570.1 transketolase [Candidatus Neomarinimicrobiota bacterium]
MSKYKDLENFSIWSSEEKDQFSVSVIKGLIMDTVRHANSGHTGGSMSSSDFVYILYKEYLQFDPKDPSWFNRDRFILSAGHESTLQYAILHLIGWLKLNDLKQFRQLHSKTPGHPEVDIQGVECTTGPLGQGFGMSTGMAFAETFLRHVLKEKLNEAKGLVDHYTYALVGDGDMQEPITLGAASLAGHLGLSHLIVYYDSNEIQISGGVSRSDSTNYATVFEGFGWHVQEIDGHNHEAIRTAIEKAQVMDKPSIIIGKTIMARGSAGMEGDHNTHGSPLPQDEIDATKDKLGLAPIVFNVPNEVINHFQSRFESMETVVGDWKKQLSVCRKNQDFDAFWSLAVEDKLSEITYPKFEEGTSLATRKAFGTTLDHYAELLPNLVGGSADLEPSNYTGNFAKNYSDFQKDNKTGRNIAFGVREFPMAVMLNGISLHGGIIPFGGTFLVFADYGRPALRLAAIQNIRVIHEFTHDSFWVGEDGPTHQPIEHAMSLRAIPNFNVFRPADAKETAICFKLAIENRNIPSALLLTRQGLPVSEIDYQIIEAGVRNGAYISQNCDGLPEIVFIATGSEVALAMDTAKRMVDKKCRIISMPCMEIFESQTDEYKNELIPNRGCLKVTLEAGITQGWAKYAGPSGLSIGIDRFGASAPGKELAHEFGFTADQVEHKIRKHLESLL